MTVAVAQLVARSVDDADAALRDALAAVADAAAAGAALVVLPECTWPGYILGGDWRQRTDDLAGYGAARDALQHAAAAARAVVVVGMARPVRGAAVNEAVVIDADGGIAGMATKRFLWDFDHRWFIPGSESLVIPTEVGRLGVMVCADGRMPEVARLLAVDGAEILVDPTAWVTSTSDPMTWTNMQFEHMLRTRALENGLWAVAANKVGVERQSVAYCGRSCIISPAGDVCAEAPSDRPGVAMATMDLRPPMFPTPRRPSLYGALARPTGEQAVASMMREPLVPGTSAVRVAVDALPEPLGVVDAQFLRDCDVGLLASPSDRVAGVATVVHRVGPDHAVGEVSGQVVGRWARTHGVDPPGERIGGVVVVGGLRVGVLLGDDALAPEVARCQMLEGAEALVWFPEAAPAAGLGPTRAAENRVPILVVPPVGVPGAAVLDANGRVVASAGSGRALVLAEVDRVAARRKEMAPGTDVVHGRQPECYGPLTS